MGREYIDTECRYPARSVCSPPLFLCCDLTVLILPRPQPTIAYATVLFQRFYLVSSVRAFALLDACHASLYLGSKLTEHTAQPRDIINVTSYLLNTPTTSPISPLALSEAHVEEHLYFAASMRLLTTELEILKALGFQTACALPYVPIINYAQVLECLKPALLRCAFGYANDALLSPSIVYLTHQPNQIAVAAIYLAARDQEESLPEAWWDVFDVDREELGFLVAVMKGVVEFANEQVKICRKKGIPWDGEAIEQDLKRRKSINSE